MKQAHTHLHTLSCWHTPTCADKGTLTCTLINSSVDWIARGRKLFKCCRTVPLQCRGSWMFCLLSADVEFFLSVAGDLSFRMTKTQVTGHLIHRRGVTRDHWLPNYHLICRPCPHYNPTYHQPIYGMPANLNKVSSCWYKWPTTGLRAGGNPSCVPQLCGVEEFIFIELLHKLYSISHNLFLSWLLSFSSVRTSLLLLSCLHLNTVSRNTNVCGL